MKQLQNLDMQTEVAGNMLIDAPELLKKEDYNKKSDLWSLGVIIYFLYFNQYPYEGKSNSEILSEIKKGQSKLKQSGNKDLDDLIRGLLREEPENRIDWNQYFTHQFFVKKKDGSENFRDFYDIEKEIGNTNNATIYRAKVKKSGESRAIKVFDNKKVRKEIELEKLRESTEGDIKPYRDSFSNEFKHMKIVEGENNENNNTVKVYEYYENKNESAVVMELCDENLFNIFKREKSSFSSNKIGEILSQLNNSFKIMNNKKLVHRALNLENILIKHEGENKKKLIFKLKLTNDSCFLGDLSKNNNCYNDKPYFKAPEILKEEKVDEKCDLWSLGEIIYVLAFHEY